MALLTLYGIDTGLKYDKFYGLSKLVAQLSGHAVPTEPAGRRRFALQDRVRHHRQLV